MAGRKPYTPTDKQLTYIEDMKAKGQSDTAIAKGLGINRGTYTKYRDKNKQIKQAIKKGTEERIRTHYDLAVDALALRLQQRTVKEVTTTCKDYMGEKQEETKTVEKVIQPADTLIMFTLVNKSKNNEWQSINKVEQKVTVDVTAPYKLEYQEKDLNGTSSSI
jgi:hypothetical protein